LAAGGTAADSAKLNGQSAAYYQVAGAKLAAIQALASAAGWLHNDGAGAFDYSTPTAANVGAEASGAVSTHNGLSTAHGFTTAGKAIANLANPGAITFLRVNANNSASLLSASNERTALGLAIGTNVQAYNSNLTGINQALDTTASPSWVTGKFSTSVFIGATAAVGAEKLRVKTVGAASTISDIINLSNDGNGYLLNSGVAINFTHNAAAAIASIHMNTAGWYNNDTEISLWTQLASGGLTDRLHILPTGSVLIGATAAVGSEKCRVNGDIYIDANCSALSFTDRTPFPESFAIAWAAIRSMKHNGKGGVDHAALHESLKAEGGRNMSASLSAAIAALQDLGYRVEKLETSH
jgi:hypothetical protein